MRWPVLFMSMFVPFEVFADEPAPVLHPPSVLAEAAHEAGVGEELARIGMLVDVGVPDGLGASLLVRPLAWVRLHAGAATNGIAPGVRGGVTLAPFSGAAAPTLTVEAAHFMPGNANALASTFGLAAPTTLLDGVSYRFASAHLGVELGSQATVSFFVRAGASYVVAATGTFDEPLDARSAVSSSALQFQALIPSLKLGFQFYAG